jgi:nucleoside-diphosphate-sugar epimerase
VPTRLFGSRQVEALVRGETISRLAGEPCLLTRGKAKEIVQKNWSCDITKATSMLGYRPAIDLIRGAEITVDWYRRNN